MLRPAGRARDPPANFPHTFLTEHTGEALSARGFPRADSASPPPATQAGRFVPNIGQAALFIGRKAAQWAAFLRLTLPAYAGRKAACIRRQKRGRRARRWLARGICRRLLIRGRYAGQSTSGQNSLAIGIANIRSTCLSKCAPTRRGLCLTSMGCVAFGMV